MVRIRGGWCLGRGRLRARRHDYRCCGSGGEVVHCVSTVAAPPAFCSEFAEAVPSTCALSVTSAPCR